MIRLSTTTLLLCLAATPLLAQVSTTVRAGNLSGTATAGPIDRDNDRDNDRDRSDHNGQIARGPRTDDTRNCDTRGVTVRSANGSSSASVTTSGGGSSVVAGAGSPGSHTQYFGCDSRDRDRDNDDRSSR